MPPPKPGHKAQLTCSDRFRKIASRLQLQAAAQRLEEEARQPRLAGWQVFQPTIRSCLEGVAAVGGTALAEQLAEAIWSEVTQAHVTADRDREDLWSKG